MIIDGIPTGAPCWVELAAPDEAVARSFYRRLFGWEATAPDPARAGYFSFLSGGAVIAGAMAASAGRWLTYLSTPDAARTAKEVEEAGGTVLGGPHPVDDLGVMVLAADPAGAPVGFWQPGTHRGFGRVAEASVPCWFHCSSSAFDAAVGFYRDVCGRPVETAGTGGGMRQVFLLADGRPMAGIMDATAPSHPVGQPAGWTVVFGAADVDGAVGRVVELGGAGVRPAEDSPYGRLAVVADPGGATISLVSAGEG